METKMSNTLSDSAVLFYKEGSSDKVYQVQLEAKSGNWVVNYQYGRRGSTLTSGTKTDSPVEYEKAVKIFQSAITSKKAKGYTEDVSGKVFAMSHNESNNTGIVPQLLNNVEEGELNKYIANNNFMMQQKFDGKRMMIRKDGNKIEAINRRGLTCGFPDIIRDQLAVMNHDFLVDGEMVGEIYYAFDYLEEDDSDLRELTALERYEYLYTALEDQCDNIKVVPNATTPAAKRKLYDRVKAEGFEGIVLKKKDAPYKPGRPNKLGDQLKFKFVATADVIVAEVNDKRSVAMRVFNGEETVNIGNCTIPPNHDIPKIGEVIEVRYLYAYPNGALYQPIYLGPRTDKEAYSCKINQLKYKAGTEEEE